MSTGLTSLVRPDGRCLVRSQGGWAAATAAAAAEPAHELGRPVLAHVDAEASHARSVLLAAGFVEKRRDAQAEMSIPVALEALGDPPLPAGVRAMSAADVDADRLRLLDDELRQDVPGTSGWRSTPSEFREHTFGDPAFDPRAYPVAVDDETGEYLALVRVWMNPGGPRLGMAGVRRERRRQGIASALLAHALGAVRSSGADVVTADYDVSNRASTRLAAKLGARRVGTQVELLYEPARSPWAVESARAVQERSRVG